MVGQIVREDVEELIQAPSACAEIVAAGERYLKAVGTVDETAARETLVGRLKKDVCSIDDLIAFTSSLDGEVAFGKETTAATKTTAKAAKADGEPNYLRDACQAGARILREAEEI